MGGAKAPLTLGLPTGLVSGATQSELLARTEWRNFAPLPRERWA